jgi:hypothetical protein
MTTTPHPDLLTDFRALKAITRGGMQAADTAAMEAYYDAIEEGKSKDEAGEVFIKEYQKMVHGK